MVNFRYHIVSIVAVFLALGIGILVGTTVVNDQTLEFLRGRINAANKRVTDIQKENALLDDERELSQRFVEEIGPALLEDRLQAVPVLVVAVEGVEEDPIEKLRTALADAAATYEGTLWLTERLRLDDEDDVDELAEILGIVTRRADAVRANLARSLGSTLLAPDVVPTPLVGELLAAGFLEYQPPGSDGPEPEALPLPGTRFAVVGGAGANLSDEALVAPLLGAMASNGQVPVVVASAAARPEDEEEQRAAATALIERVRDDSTLAERMSTVDNLDQFAGQAATVLALQDLGSQVVGHFGVGDGAQSLLPPSLS